MDCISQFLPTFLGPVSRLYLVPTFSAPSQQPLCSFRASTPQFDYISFLYSSFHTVLPLDQLGWLHNSSTASKVCYKKIHICWNPISTITAEEYDFCLISAFQLSCECILLMQNSGGKQVGEMWFLGFQLLWQQKEKASGKELWTQSKAPHHAHTFSCCLGPSVLISLNIWLSCDAFQSVLFSLCRSLFLQLA